ncbi:MAG: polyhydroxyalkanoate synthesis repressor PhaR [Pseudomonadota bacterium]
MAEPHLIKKYANRRLYDTVTSSHITLDGIRDLVVSGTDVRIVDDTNGEDITRSLLLQIIAERELGGKPMLDAGFLMSIIRLYGNPMQDLVGEFLNNSFETFMGQQAKYQQQMREAMQNTPLSTMQDLTESNLKAWQAMQDAMLGKTRKSDSKPE